jgi:glycosyl transferase family 25
MPAELFEGSYGDVIAKKYKEENRILHPWGIKGPNKLFSMDYRMAIGTPGEKGCFDSHYTLWKKCIELDEPILIFEDDATVIRKFIPVAWKDILSVVSSHHKKMRKYIQYLEKPEGIPEAAPYGQGSMPGNAGYAIKPHAAKILVDEYKNTFLPADNAINQSLVTIQIHSYMMGKAEPRDSTHGKSSLIRTKLWDIK